MERNEFADDYIDRVVRRSEKDMIIKMKLALLAAVVPALMSAVVGTAVYSTNMDLFVGDSMMVGMIVGISVECSILSFILYTFARRSYNHSRRDRGCMAALSGYAGSKGCDVSRLDEIRHRVTKRTGLPSLVMSFVMWVFTVVYLVILGAMFRGGLTAEDDVVYMMAFVSYVLLLIQFLLTLGASYRFPYKHDSLQVEFSREFSDRCEEFGLRVKPMERIISKPKTILNILLFVVTLGLYTVVLLLASCYNMNKHLYAQWDSEEKLVNAIVEHEGGRGIEGIGTNQPESTVMRVLKNLI